MHFVGKVQSAVWQNYQLCGRWWQCVNLQKTTQIIYIMRSSSHLPTFTMSVTISCLPQPLFRTQLIMSLKPTEPPCGTHCSGSGATRNRASSSRSRVMDVFGLATFEHIEDSRRYFKHLQTFTTGAFKRNITCKWETTKAARFGKSGW